MTYPTIGGMRSRHCEIVPANLRPMSSVRFAYAARRCGLPLRAFAALRPHRMPIRRYYGSLDPIVHPWLGAIETGYD